MLIFLEFRDFFRIPKTSKMLISANGVARTPPDRYDIAWKKLSQCTLYGKISNDFLENSEIYFRILMKMFIFLEFSTFLEFLESLPIFHTEVLRVGGPGSPLTTQGTKHGHHHNSLEEY